MINAHHLGVAPPRRSPHWPAERFYVPPEPLPPGAPGDLIRAEPMDAYLLPGVRLAARAWRVLYRSTSAVGEPTAVSGTVLLPRVRARRPRPLLGYAVGTHGIGDGAAPSRLLARGLDYEAPVLAAALARGWAVAVTDYEGLGTPGDHTYLVGRALGPNVLDAMRAARALAPRELPAEAPAAIMGYSEGGHAAAWALQLQPAYAPDLPLTAGVVGAAPADPERAAKYIEGKLFSFFIAYGGIGYAAAYPELDLEPYLTARGRREIAAMRNSSVVGAALRGPHFARATELTDPNVLELPEWRLRMRENRLGTMAPAAPVLIHHARRDQIVSYAEGLDLRDAWQTLGADVRLYATRGAVDHMSGLLAGAPVALDWLARRLAAPAAISGGAGVEQPFREAA